MSKKKTEAPETGLDELNDSLTKVTTGVQENKKMIAIISAIVLAVCAIILAYVYFFRSPAMNRANDNIGEADLALAQGNDSTALATYRKIADDGSFDAGNRAALQTAILLYQQGSEALSANDEAKAKKLFTDALTYAENYSVEDDIIGAGAYSLQGDCLVNLDRLDDAAKKFEKAIKVSDDNPAYTPYFMFKLATVYEAQKKYKEQLALLQEVQTKYPQYCNVHRIDLEAQIELATLRAK